MPVRLLKPHNGQNVGTLYWGTDQQELRAVGVADDQIELASDYSQIGDRAVTAATATVSHNAKVYRMNSGSAQTLTLNASGYFPKDTVLTIIQEGAGATTVSPGTGVTIGGNSATTGANKVLQLIKGAGDTWVGLGG